MGVFYKRREKPKERLGNDFTRTRFAVLVFTMGKFFKWLFALVSVAALGALFDLGFRHLFTPGGVGSSVSWLEQLIGPAAFPWVVGGALGFGAGGLLDWFGRKFDEKFGSKETRFGKSTLRLGSVGDALQAQLVVWQFQKGSTYALQRNLTAKYIAGVVSMEKLKIDLPELTRVMRLETGEEKIKALSSFLEFVRALEELSIDGHLPDARKLAKDFSASFRADYPR